MEHQTQKKAVIYCRVSTKEQVEEGNSLVTQEKNCREYANKYNYQISAVFIEQGESAKTADRTELKKLLSFCSAKKNEISAVIAYKIDRISRNTDDYSQIRILLKRYGVEIKSTSEYFEDTPAGRFMENIIANVAQFDNDVRTERTIGGMKEAVREGRYVWKAPYGYTNVTLAGKSTIMPNHLATLIQKTFEEIATDLHTIEEARKRISQKLFDGFPAKQIPKGYFYRLLRNELYTGWINKFGERHKGSFEPIISEEIFQRVQYVISRRSKKGRVYISDSPDFPLRRFIFHPSGKKLTGCWSKGKYKKYPYYFFHYIKMNFRKDFMEDLFVSWLNKFKMSEAHIDTFIVAVKRKTGQKIKDKWVNRDGLTKSVSELKAKQALLIEKNIEGVLSNELCKERLAAIEIELQKINAHINNLPDTEINIEFMSQILRLVLSSPGELWKKLSFHQKIKLQWFYFPNGIEFDGKESRTPKICKIFELERMFLSHQSLEVTHRFKKSNTQNQQIALNVKVPVQEKFSKDLFDLEFIADLLKEFKEVDKIVSQREGASVSGDSFR